MQDRLDGKLGMGAMMPTLQHAAEGVIPFITERPTSTVEMGNYDHLPLMMGVTRHEGIYFLDCEAGLLYILSILWSLLAYHVLFSAVL